MLAAKTQLGTVFDQDPKPGVTQDRIVKVGGSTDAFDMLV